MNLSLSAWRVRAADVDALVGLLELALYVCNGSGDSCFDIGVIDTSIIRNIGDVVVAPVVGPDVAVAVRLAGDLRGAIREDLADLVDAVVAPVVGLDVAVEFLDTCPCRPTRSCSRWRCTPSR